MGFTKARQVRFPAAGSLRLTRSVLFARPATSEPTPWATGLTVTAIVAAVSLATDLVLSLSLRMSYGWLWIPANVLLCAGLSPTVWLLRNTPTWRWVSYGMVIGFGCAWLVLVIMVLVIMVLSPAAAVAIAGS